MSTISESSGAQQSLAEGPIRFGSDAHKTLFCRTLLDTFNPYKPAVIDWPTLDSQTRDRLVSLPIWDIAVQTEGRARLNVATYAATTSDPLLRKAIELNAFEDGRHKHVLSNLVAAYGIALAPEPQYVVPGDPEWAFMVTGAKSVGDDINVAELIDICLAENRRRMSPYDRRLLRPTAVPALARLARRCMRS